MSNLSDDLEIIRKAMARMGRDATLAFALSADTLEYLGDTGHHVVPLVPITPFPVEITLYGIPVRIDSSLPEGEVRLIGENEVRIINLAIGPTPYLVTIEPPLGADAWQQVRRDIQAWVTANRLERATFLVRGYSCEIKPLYEDESP